MVHYGAVKFTHLLTLQKLSKEKLIFAKHFNFFSVTWLNVKCLVYILESAIDLYNGFK